MSLKKEKFLRNVNLLRLTAFVCFSIHIINDSQSCLFAVDNFGRIRVLWGLLLLIFPLVEKMEDEETSRLRSFKKVQIRRNTESVQKTVTYASKKKLWWRYFKCKHQKWFHRPLDREKWSLSKYYDSLFLFYLINTGLTLWRTKLIAIFSTKTNVFTGNPRPIFVITIPWVNVSKCE